MVHSRARRARMEANLSQQATADKAGIPRSQLQLLEKGGNVTRETLEKALAALGLTLVAVSAEEIAGARKALRELDAFLGLLAGDTAPAPAGSTAEPDDLSEEDRIAIRELDALVDLEKNQKKR
jgi:transcriptional regulator with XRE-family HTH domain